VSTEKTIGFLDFRKKIMCGWEEEKSSEIVANHDTFP
jgi:hypothetical protein